MALHLGRFSANTKMHPGPMGIALQEAAQSPRLRFVAAALIARIFKERGQTSQAIEWFIRLFEPLLMIAIGVVIGIVVLLMYAPIFELAGSLQ